MAEPKRLAGATAQHIRLDEISRTDTDIVAAEGALFRARFSFEGSAGNTYGGVCSGFFDDLKAAFHPLDDLKLHVGNAHLHENNYLTYGLERGIPGRRRKITSLFTKGGKAEGGSQ